MNRQQSQINRGKAGPKGASAESSGARGNEGGNTRRDFVRPGKGKTHTSENR